MQKTISLIDLSAIRRNALHMKSLACGAKFYAVVKADAYGHGAIEVAKELSDVCDGFCVAIADEGVELRAAGISPPVLVFTPPLDEGDAARMSAYDLTATVADERSAELCENLNFHLKINTGMNRYGCPPLDLPRLIKKLDKDRLLGVYTHMYAPRDEARSRQQLELFRESVAVVKKFAPGAVAHMAATAGVLSGKEYLFDGVRCGISLYGYCPEGFSDSALLPALRVYARRVQTFSPPVGDGAGYGVADKKHASLSSYRAGYGDGFSRTVSLGEGNLCMDAFVREGEEENLLIFGDADDYAARAGTISYEALCAVTKRSVRVYERRPEV